jgi:hypothetical protein
LFSGCRNTVYHNDVDEGKPEHTISCGIRKISAEPLQQKSAKSALGGKLTWELFNWIQIEHPEIYVASGSDYVQLKNSQVFIQLAIHHKSFSFGQLYPPLFLERKEFSLKFFTEPDLDVNAVLRNKNLDPETSIDVMRLQKKLREQKMVLQKIADLHQKKINDPVLLSSAFFVKHKLECNRLQWELHDLLLKVE